MSLILIRAVVISAPIPAIVVFIKVVIKMFVRHKCKHNKFNSAMATYALPVTMLAQVESELTNPNYNRRAGYLTAKRHSKDGKPRVGTSAHKEAIWRLPGAHNRHGELCSNVFKIKK